MGDEESTVQHNKAQHSYNKPNRDLNRIAAREKISSYCIKAWKEFHLS